MTLNMIHIVAFGVGLKCPRKIHLNTQWRGPPAPGSDGPRGDAGTDKLSTQNHCPKLKSKQYHDKTVNFLPEIDPILFPKNICQSGRKKKKRGFVPTSTFFNLFMALAA